MKSALTFSIFMLVAAVVSGGAGKREGAAGEIDYRIGLIRDRIVNGTAPRITQDFLLAGLTLDPRFERRFTNFSGDQIGRYLSAMVRVDVPGNPVDIHELVRLIAANQKSDGRFGADTLVFEAETMEGPHMALLWGNGRLLTGLMDYYGKYPDRRIALETGVRLADFLTGVTDACTRPEIVERFKTMGALGYICFTQITEGLVKLYHHTGNGAYLRTAERIYPLVPEFGNQHSHGFLNTMRGVVMLYEVTKDPRHLDYAENIYDAITASVNYMITGGVPEFFSFHAAGGEGVRDEGCSEADFFMFCLQLWRATGKMKYLDAAEYLFANHMLFNQFDTGDFGSHKIDTRDWLGFNVATMQARCWWCCNYHGLQAFVEARDALFSMENRNVKVHLYYPGVYDDGRVRIRMEKIRHSVPRFRIAVEKARSENIRLSLRNPDWSEKTTMRLNGREIEAPTEKEYLVLDRKWKPKDAVEITFRPVVKLVGRDRLEILFDRLTEKPLTAALIYGPWLMTADDIFEPFFSAELSGGNVIYWTGAVAAADVARIPGGSFNPEAYLSFPYRHEGMYETNRVVLRPLSEMTFQNRANVRFWFNFAKRTAKSE